MMDLKLMIMEPSERENEVLLSTVRLICATTACTQPAGALLHFTRAHSKRFLTFSIVDWWKTEAFLSAQRVPRAKTILMNSFQFLKGPRFAGPD
jgi:hypothetical protein